MGENALNLEEALVWLKEIISGCLQIHSGQIKDVEVGPLNLHNDNSWLAQFIASRDPSFEEFALLMLVMPHLHPQFFFNKLIAKYLPEGGDFPEFGGVKGTNHRGMLPTGETAQFILAGDNLENA